MIKESRFEGRHLECLAPYFGRCCCPAVWCIRMKAVQKVQWFFLDGVLDLWWDREPSTGSYSEKCTASYHLSWCKNVKYVSILLKCTNTSMEEECEVTKSAIQEGLKRVYERCKNSTPEWVKKLFLAQYSGNSISVMTHEYQVKINEARMEIYFCFILYTAWTLPERCTFHYLFSVFAELSW